MTTEHLSNVGFHLNLRGRVEEARDVLEYARDLDPSHADARNNLAFSLSALGDGEAAEDEQKQALSADPTNGHIRSRYEAMSGQAVPDRATDAVVPPGWDFGEAYFRLGKRHTIREYRAGKEWHKEKELTDAKISGGTPPVAGPFEWYSQRTHDIGVEAENRRDRAPRELVGCPFGSGIHHPSCANAPSPRQVARSRHNREAALWRCEQVRLRHSADLFQFPVEAAYTQWPEELEEDSEDFWSRTLPNTAERWQDLKSRVQNLAPCKATLPPLRPMPARACCNRSCRLVENMKSAGATKAVSPASPSPRRNRNSGSRQPTPRSRVTRDCGTDRAGPAEPNTA